MKIKIIDLLKMFADGKIPSKIFYYDKYFVYDKQRHNYFSADGSEVDWKYTVMDYINDEVEIIEPSETENTTISQQFEKLGYAMNKVQKCFSKGWDTANEENKKIEKIPYISVENLKDEEEKLLYADLVDRCFNKINELIDEINKLKEK